MIGLGRSGSRAGRGLPSLRNQGIFHPINKRVGRLAVGQHVVDSQASLAARQPD
jgi:hypothetical protein